MSSRGAVAYMDTTGTSDWDRLHEIVREKSYSYGTEVRLASGKLSKLYFNMKPTMMDPEGSYLIAKLILQKLTDESADYVGGLAVGAVPIISSVVSMSFENSRPVPGVFVREKPKQHGTKLLIEGPEENDLRGKRVIMVDDVTTTGGSVYRAIEVIQEAGGVIDTVISVADRLEGAEKNLAAKGIRLEAIFTARDFLPEGSS